MEPIIQSALNEYVIPSLVTAVGSLLVYLLGFAAKWLKSHVGDARFQGAVDKLTHLATQAVHEQEQNMVKALKVSGDWNLTTQLAAKDKAREVVERHLGERGLAALQVGMEHSGSDGRIVVRGMLDSAIEAAVFRMGTGGLALGTVERISDDPTRNLED